MVGTLRLDRKKHDFAKVCKTCRGHRHIIGADEGSVVKCAIKMFGKAGELFEGTIKDGELGPRTAYRMDCPACKGSGVEMYVPKYDLIVPEGPQ